MQDEVRLQRFLLLDAYPDDLANRGRIEEKDTFVEIRYQPGAFFVRTAVNSNDLEQPFLTPGGKGSLHGGDVTDSIAAGWFGGSCWSIANGVLTTDTLSPELLSTYSHSNNNPAILQLSMFLPAKIMNFGLPSEKIGSLRWSGERTEGTNRLGFKWFAELKTDASGRPVGAAVTLPSYPVSAGSVGFQFRE